MEPKKKGALLSALRPLANLWPGILTLVLVLAALPFTKPVLAQIPERLELPAQESVQPEPEQEPAEETPVPLGAEMTENTYPDGVYTGSAQGYGGAVSVRVTVEGGCITGIEILSAGGETASFFNRAMGVVEAVLARQTWEVDAVSGATYSSKGILGAIENALTGETVTTPQPEQTGAPAAAVQESFSEPAGYVDGVYYGSATGFGGTIQVAVTISGGKIASVQVVSAAGETPSYLSKAEAVLSRIVEANSPNVDAVSGATYSSTGILNAAKRALAQASSNGQTEEPEETAPAETAPQPEEPVVIDPSVLPQEVYLDGTYLGAGEGFGGEILVQVTVTEGRIAEIRIVQAEDETPAYLEQAEQVIPAVLASQSTQVDAVSGATFSSRGILEGIENALAQAIPPEEEEEETECPEETVPTEGEETEPPEESPAEYRDGTYSATVWCTDEEVFRYQVQVTITVEEGKITGVQVTKGEDLSEFPEDNDSYLSYAVNGRQRGEVWYPGLVEQILTRQSAEEVDVVSRATYSSLSIQQGARQALVQAAAAESETEESQ